MRYIHFDVANKESYSLDSVGKHGFGRLLFFKKKSFSKPAFSQPKRVFLPAAMEIGPQPHGVVRSNIYTAMKDGVQHMLDWVRSFNSGATAERRKTSALPRHHLYLFCFFKRSSPEVLFLKADAWTSSPWSNTWTTRETQKVATSSLPFTRSFR